MKRKSNQPSLLRTLNRNGSFNVDASTDKTFSLSEVYHYLLSLSWAQFITVLISTYFGVNILYGAAYYACGPEGLEGVPIGSAWQHMLSCFFFSVQTFATIGYGKISPHGIIPNLLVTFEALTGLLSLSIATGLLFSRFARSTASIAFARYGVQYVHDGMPSILFRIANKRNNQISEAKISATLMITEITKEGESYRNFHDLKLDREHTPVFSLTWTVLHVIDEHSPFFKKSRDELVAAHAEILLSLVGTDDTFLQSVHSRFSYTMEEVLVGKRYVDILGTTADGRVRVDLAKFHEVMDAV